MTHTYEVVTPRKVISSALVPAAGTTVTRGRRAQLMRFGAAAAHGVSLPPQVAHEMSMEVADHWVTMICSKLLWGEPRPTGN